MKRIGHRKRNSEEAAAERSPVSDQTEHLPSHRRLNLKKHELIQV
jgi:hypothetical protein